MIFTQPYCVPTISGLNEMCTAGGGDSKLYRLRLPFDPDEMVWCGCESFIRDYFLFSAICESFMCYPAFAIPDFHFGRHVLYWYESVIGQHELPFGDTRQLSYFSALP